MGPFTGVLFVDIPTNKENSDPNYQLNGTVVLQQHFFRVESWIEKGFYLIVNIRFNIISLFSSYYFEVSWVRMSQSTSKSGKCKEAGWFPSSGFTKCYAQHCEISILVNPEHSRCHMSDDDQHRPHLRLQARSLNVEKTLDINFSTWKLYFNWILLVQGNGNENKFSRTIQTLVIILDSSLTFEIHIYFMS